MCGIGGAINFSPKVTNPKFPTFLENLAERGTDATGFSYFNGKDWLTIKAGIPADEFVKTKEIQGYLSKAQRARIALLHCRAATEGSPESNLNNHPIVNDDGILIHNGIVFFGRKLKAEGETDSEQLLLHIQKYGIRGALTKATGSATFAHIELKRPWVVWLYRRGTPLAVIQTAEQILFGSTKDILLRSAQPKGRIQELGDGDLWRIDTRTARIRRENVKAIQPKQWGGRSLERGRETQAKASRPLPLPQSETFHSQDAEIGQGRLLGIHPYLGNIGEWGGDREAGNHLLEYEGHLG